MTIIKKFWDAFGIAFKEGIYEDFTNRIEIAGLSRFYSTHDTERLTSLDDYITGFSRSRKLFIILPEMMSKLW